MQTHVIFFFKIQPRCPTTGEWNKKMLYLYTMEFYSAVQKNEILSFAGKWMELENIILSKVSQAQKTEIPCSPSYVDFRSRANTAVWLDLDHMTEESTNRRYGDR
jgi:hypothetical protein